MRDVVLNTLARLLATENIDIRHGNGGTTDAYFDVEKRILTLPKFSDVDEERYMMYLVHEVSHAIYTPAKEWTNLIAADPSIKTYVNIVEDARIERLIKKRYPGTRVDLARGYKKFHAMDAFNLSNLGDRKMSLIDRLNIRAKIGAYYVVNFGDDELEFVERFDTLSTWDEAVTLAMNLRSHAQRVSRGIEQTGNRAPSSDKDLSESSSGDLIEDQKNDNSDSTRDDTASVDADPFTQDSFDKTLAKDIVKSRSRFSENVIKIDYSKFDYKHYVTPLRDHIEYLRNNPNYCAQFETSVAATYSPEALPKFNSKNRTTVAYLLKEFETKRAADVLSRARDAKTGVLSPNKLHLYKFSEDLFKKTMVIPEGKSHGLVMFVDFSSSMHLYIEQVIEQLVMLVSFCRSAGIKHRVFSFTQRYNERYGALPTVRAMMRASFPSVDYIDPNTDLLELFSDEMTGRDFSLVASALLTSVGKGFALYTMGRTPLDSTIILARPIVREFKARTGAQCVSVVFLTDGESDYPTYDIRCVIDGDTRQELPSTSTVSDGTSNNISRFSDYTDRLIRNLRAVLGVEVINFRICEKDRHLKYILTENMRREFTRTGCVSVPEARGFSTQHFITAKMLRANSKSDWFEDAVTDRQVARAFAKGSANRLRTRYILSDFVTRISKPLKNVG